MHVCVAIPTVNRLELLRLALESVREQSYRDFHVLLSENSGDAEYARAVDGLVKEFTDFRIDVRHQSPQLSMARNANFLVDHGEGDAWVYLPDDDALCPEFLTRLVGALKTHPEAAFAFSDHWLMDARGNLDHAATDANSRHWGRASLSTGMVPAEQMAALGLAQSFELQSMLFRMDVIRQFRFRVEVEPVLDFDLELRLATSGLRAFYVGERLTKYRIHGGQVTQIGKQELMHRAMVDALLASSSAISSTEKPAWRRKLAFHHRALAVLAARDGRASQARTHAWDALWRDPSARRAAEWSALRVLPSPVLRGLVKAREMLRL